MEAEFFKWVNGSYNKPTDFDQLTFQQSNTLYKEALTLDPNNKDAQFGVGMTEMLTAYADPEINSLIKQIDSSMNDNKLEKSFYNGLLPISTSQMEVPLVTSASNIFAVQKLALTDPPLISKIQQVLKDKLLPRIQTAIDKLSKLDTDTTFSFTVTGKMQGDPNLKPYKIYCTEVALSNGLMNGLKFMLEQFLIYQFPLADYKQATLLSALAQSNTTFFVLAPDGQQRAANAKTALQTMITKIQTGIQMLETFSNKKADAIIKIGNDGLKQTDLDSVKKYLTKALSAFNQSVTVHLEDADTDGNDYDIQINLGNFFSNLPQNPKQAYLPPYNVVAVGTDKIDIKFVAQTYNQFIFPDPTFGNTYPGMTNETLKRILQIDKNYAYRLDGFAQFEYNYWPGINNATIKIYTQTGSYTAKTDWGEFELYVRSATTTPDKILKYTIDYGSGEVELKFNDTTRTLDVLAKQHDWVEIIIPKKAENLTAIAYTNPLRVQLNWKVNGSGSGYSQFVVERKTLTGQFVKIHEQTFNNFNFTDNNVSSGSTYQYRIRTNNASEKQGSYSYLFPKESFYSNIVTITP
jgi:hypothetical protein